MPCARPWLGKPPLQGAPSSQLTRHFERAIAAVKYAVMLLVMAPYLVPTDLMDADIFTKAVDQETFHRCKHSLRNTRRGEYVSRKIDRLKAALSRATRA